MLCSIMFDAVAILYYIIRKGRLGWHGEPNHFKLNCSQSEHGDDADVGAGEEIISWQR